MIIMHWQSQNKKRRVSKLWTKQTKQNQDHDIAHCMDDEKQTKAFCKWSDPMAISKKVRVWDKVGCGWGTGRMDEEWRYARAEGITTMYPYMSVGGCE